MAAALALAGFPSLAQEPARKDKAFETKGMPPRQNPAEYQTATKVGQLTMAADFAGHGVPTADGLYSNEEYLVVEVAFFGPAGSHLNLSYKDFSLRINGKKSPVAAQSYEGAFSTLKDPEWTPPPTDPKSKGSSFNTNGQTADPPPAPPKMPMNLRLVMEQKVQRAAVPEGERPLPVAGILFFQHGGKVSGIRSLELIYEGAAGKGKLSLQ
ncbi:MAG: hypothetical protein KGN84_18695 [Acidobacteriota bacterium]|nr:hypothetical protein [Acidobacteriota bacterium]